MRISKDISVNNELTIKFQILLANAHYVCEKRHVVHSLEVLQKVFANPHIASMFSKKCSVIRNSTVRTSHGFQVGIHWSSCPTAVIDRCFVVSKPLATLTTMMNVYSATSESKRMAILRDAWLYDDCERNDCHERSLGNDRWLVVGGLDGAQCAPSPRSQMSSVVSVEARLPPLGMVGRAVYTWRHIIRVNTK